MAKSKGHKGNLIPQKILSPEDLVKLVRESGIPVHQIEKGIGMPITTLDKCLKGEIVQGKWTRTLPAKYEAPLIKYIREKRIEKEELQFEVKETLIEHNIEVKEKEVFIPDEKRKLDWIAKLQEVKAELESTNQS